MSKLERMLGGDCSEVGSHGGKSIVIGTGAQEPLGPSSGSWGFAHSREGMQSDPLQAGGNSENIEGWRERTLCFWSRSSEAGVGLCALAVFSSTVFFTMRGDCFCLRGFLVSSGFSVTLLMVSRASLTVLGKAGGASNILPTWGIEAWNFHLRPWAHPLALS